MRHHPQIVLLLTLLLLPQASRAQQVEAPQTGQTRQPTVAATQTKPTAESAERERFRFDFARLFPAATAPAQSDESRLNRLVTRLETLKGRVNSSAENLYRALALYDEARAVEMHRYFSFTLRSMVDTRDVRSSRAAADLDTQFTRRTAFVGAELARLSADTEGRYLKILPKLKTYRFALDDARRSQAHTLSTHDEELLGQISPLALDWQADLYDRLLSRGLRDKPDYDLYAFTLLRLARARNQAARLHRFKDATDETYFRLYLTTADVTLILDTLAQQADLHRQLERDNREQAARLEALFKTSDGKPRPRPASLQPPQFALPDALQTVQEALSPLGPEYAREVKALFDPANGRIDIAGGTDRHALGTGWGFPASQPSILYWPAFTGTYDDLDRGLAHEGGHAVHFQFMRNAGVPPCYSDGPGYLFESYAIFNQILLADYLYHHETDPNRKIFFLSQLLSKMTAPIWLAVTPAVDHALYLGVDNHTINSATDLTALSDRTRLRYGLPSAPTRPGPQPLPEWISTPHHYQAPLYTISHTLGNILALCYYQQYQSEPKRFLPRYLALLHNGFNDTPDNLLKRFLNLNLRDPQMITTSLSLVKPRLAELEALHAEQLKALQTPL